MPVAHWNPWIDFETFGQVLNPIFDLPFPRLFDNGDYEPWQPRTDISETDAAYVVEVDLPGMTMHDISVQLEGTTVMIAGQRQSEQSVVDDGELIEVGVAQTAVGPIVPAHDIAHLNLRDQRIGDAVASTVRVRATRLVLGQRFRRASHIARTAAADRAEDCGLIGADVVPRNRAAVGIERADLVAAIGVVAANPLPAPQAQLKIAAGACVFASRPL